MEDLGIWDRGKGGKHKNICRSPRGVWKVLGIRGERVLRRIFFGIEVFWGEREISGAERGASVERGAGRGLEMCVH